MPSPDLVDALDVGEAVRRVRHRLVRRAPRRGAVRAEQRAERAAEATEVAEVVLFLASDEASYCTGHEFVVDGAMVA